MGPGELSTEDFGFLIPTETLPPCRKAPSAYMLVSTMCAVTKCVFITAVPITKLFAGEGDSGGHVLRETTSRGLCGLVCPLRTSERGGEGDWVREGGGGEGERERERGSVKSLHYSPEEHGTV